MDTRQHTDDVMRTLEKLAPWHQDIALPSGLRTIEGNQPGSEKEVAIVNPNHLKVTLEALYQGAGISGKSFLDVGCNGGGYCFLAKELGGKTAFGFDPREHWIEQAKFVRSQLGYSDAEVEFAIHTLDGLLERNQLFDVTLFKGVFYHLPDPIKAVDVLASKTRDLMIIDTSSVYAPAESLVSRAESTTALMSGVDGFSWFPNGPQVVAQICEFYGFGHTHLIYNRLPQKPREGEKGELGRFAIVAAREVESLPRAIRRLDADG